MAVHVHGEIVEVAVLAHCQAGVIPSLGSDAPHPQRTVARGSSCHPCGAAGGATTSDTRGAIDPHFVSLRDKRPGQLFGLFRPGSRSLRNGKGGSAASRGVPEKDVCNTV